MNLIPTQGIIKLKRVINFDFVPVYKTVDDMRLARKLGKHKQFTQTFHACAPGVLIGFIPNMHRKGYKEYNEMILELTNKYDIQYVNKGYFPESGNYVYILRAGNGQVRFLVFDRYGDFILT